MVNLLYLFTWLLLAAAAVFALGRWLMPFVMAFVTAALLQRPVKWMTGRTRAPRGFLSGVLVVAVVLAVAGIAALLGWRLWRWGVSVFRNEAMLAELAGTASRAVNTLREQLTVFGARFSPETREALAAAFGSVFSGSGAMLGDWIGAAAGRVLSFAAGRLPQWLMAFFVWVMASVFLTVDYGRVTAFLLRQIPAHRRALAEEVRGLVTGTLGQLGRAYFLLMLLTFGELLAGLWLLRVPGAVALAALIALVDILPVLGVGTVLIPWAAVAWLGGDPRLGVWLLMLYLVITVVRNLAEPRLIGGRVGLPPLVTLLCLYLGFQLAGLAGVLLFPLVATLLVQLRRRGHLPLWK